MIDWKDKIGKYTNVATETKPDVDDLLAQIRDLVGAEEFKMLAQDYARVAPALVEKKIPEVLTSRVCLLSVNDGYGATTYIKLLTKLLFALCVFSKEDEDVFEVVLPSDDKNEYSDLKSKARKVVEDSITVFDISAWMTKVGDLKFREFLQELDKREANTFVVLKMPFVEKDVLDTVRAGIEDVVSVDVVSIPPLDMDELKESVRREFDRYGYTTDDGVWSVIEQRIISEKSDGRFYGFKTINKIVREAIYVKHRTCADGCIGDKIIQKDEILEIARDDYDNRTGEQILDSLEGLTDVKRKIQEVVAQIEHCSKNKNVDAPCIHMRFEGSPGTGKTTVARAVGRLLRERGVLRNGNFFEHSGRSLCGSYVGQTAPKTAAICRDAYGSVLFIDEAYSLYRSENDEKDYGREAIDTLIAEMENHRDDLVVIMAGYSDEMSVLMNSNSGLASRMPYVIEFPNYSRQELVNIFMKMARKSFKCADGLEQAVREYFESMTDEQLSSREFSNARYVRNLFERTWCKSVMRAQLDKQTDVTIIKEDFICASSDGEFSGLVRKKKKTIGFQI